MLYAAGVYTAHMTEEDLQLTARRLSSLCDDLILAWEEREAVTGRLRKVQREGPPAPPQPQPIEDFTVLARHARERKRHAKHLMETTTAKEEADIAYATAAAALVAELVPEDISGEHTYLSVAHTYPDGSTYIIDIRPDSASVRRQE